MTIRTTAQSEDVVAEGVDKLSVIGEETECQSLARAADAQRRADRLGKIGQKCLGPVYPGYMEAYMTIRPLLVRLTAMKTREAYRSFKMISQLQRVVQFPYLPSSVVRAATSDDPSIENNSKSYANLVPADDPFRKSVLRICVILSSAVYPANNVVSHGVKGAKASGPWLDMKYRIEHLAKGVRVIDFVEQGKVGEPAYAVAVDASHASMYIVVRGTSQPEDFVTDMMCDPTDGGLGPHRGMSLSSEYIDKRVRKRALEYISTTPEASIILTGHSLGAGTVALLCNTWVKDPVMQNVAAHLRCVAIACPAIMNELDDFIDTDRVTTIVFGKDLVPRLSFGSFRDLLIQMNCLAKLESRQRNSEADDAASAISTLSSTPSTVASTADMDLFSDEDAEWKSLPERLDGVENYQSSRSFLLSSVNFAGLGDLDRAEQNQVLAKQLAHCSVTFGGASFNQINGILKRRIAILDARRKELMKHPEAAGIDVGRGLKGWLMKVFWKIGKFFVGQGWKRSTAYLKTTNETEELVLLENCLKELYEVHSSHKLRFLTPPGRILLCVPTLHFLEINSCLPKRAKKSLLGQCYLYEIDRTEFSQNSMTPSWSIGALNQHKMECYLQALAPDTIKQFPLEAILSNEEARPRSSPRKPANVDGGVSVGVRDKHAA